MKVRRFYRPGALYAVPSDTIREAARKMHRGALSCLPVLDAGRVVGIVTERDVVKAVAKGPLPLEAEVMDYMNDGSVTVTPDDDSATAELTMLAIGCRHLPVVDRGALVGMVSARDLFLMRADDATPRIPVPAAMRRADRVWPDEPPPDVDSEP